MMESNITLESLIEEQKARVSQLKYEPDPPGGWGVEIGRASCRERV